MVGDLTGMPVANASLLDEATAAAEAMAMMHRVRARTAPGADRLLVSRHCFPQTIDVVRGRAEPLDIAVEVGDPAAMRFDGSVFGVLLQTPAEDGAVLPVAEVVARAHEAGALAAVCTDLLALTLMAPRRGRGIRADGPGPRRSAASLFAASRVFGNPSVTAKGHRH